MKNKIIHIYFLLIAGTLAGFGQITISPTVQPSTGGYLTNGNLQLQYTIGEPLNQTFKAGGYEFSLGFNQPEMNLTVSTLTGPFCAGAQINIPFTAKGIYSLYNVFTAQLSDSSGSFASPVSIGGVMANISGVIPAVIPDSTILGGNYKIRVVSLSPILKSAPSSPFSIHPLPSIANDTIQQSVVCTGSSTNVYVFSTQNGIRYDLMVDSNIITTAYGNGDTLIFNTGSIDSNTLFYVLATDTVTGCNRQLMYLNAYTLKIDNPSNIAPQGVVSDTPYTFTFGKILTGLGGNYIVWALDSSFTYPNTDTNLAIINITLAPGSDTLIWLKSLDTVTGCTSNVITTMAIVDTTMSVPAIISDTAPGICTGSSSIATVAYSLPAVFYKLRIDSTVIDSSYGNYSLLTLNTHVIDTTTTFNIIGTDTANNIVYLDSSIYIAAIGAVDTPVFTGGDTFVYKYDTTWAPYSASAANSSKIRYSISSGVATIDSVTGQLGSVSGYFTVQATAFGLPGCGTVTAAWLPVTVTGLSAPVPPAPQNIVIDSETQVVTLTFNSTYSDESHKSDEIEWSFNADFSTSTTLASPATISFSLQGPQRKAFYLRSKDSKSGDVSKAAKSYGGLVYQQFTAALLDKANWVYDAASNFSDEFEWKGKFPYDAINNFPNVPLSQSFTKKWFIAHTVGFPLYNQRNSKLCNYVVPYMGYEGYDDIMVWDLAGYYKYLIPSVAIQQGSNGEVTFTNGISRLHAAPLGYPLSPAVYTGSILDCSNAHVSYSSGMLYSNIPMDLTQPGMIEMRAQLPYSCGSYVAFWNDVIECRTGELNPLDNNPVGYAEMDVIDGYSSSTTPQTGTIGTGGGVGNHSCTANTYCNGIDPSCRYSINKITPCDYQSGWHTWTAVWDPTVKKIVYFVDGKEIWDYDYGMYAYPLNMLTSAYWTVQMAITGCESFPYDMYIDYIRHYTPTAGTSASPRYFQSLYTGSYTPLLGSPLTLESTPRGSSFQNNTPVTISGSNGQSTVSITPSTNLGILNTGALTNLYYISNNKGYVFTTPMFDVNAGNLFSTGTEQVINPSVTQVCNGIPYYYPDGKLKGWNWIVSQSTTNHYDVNNFITPVNSNLIYYQSNNSELRYYQKSGNFWIEGLAVNRNTGINPYSTNPEINFCAGYIAVDFSGKVFFKGTDNNLYRWTPSTGALLKITNDGSVTGAVSVNSNCGCIAFYRNGDNLMQVSGSTGTTPWIEREVVSSSSFTVTDNMALDDVNSRIYFIGSNSAVYYYKYNINAAASNGMQILGALSTEPSNSGIDAPSGSCSYNAGSALALSNDKNTLYYIGTDGNIWYYFNDHDPYNANNTGGNWNRTALSYNVQVKGPLIFEPNTTWGGRLYYVDNNSELDAVTYTTADYPADCPSCQTNVYDNYNVKSDTVVKGTDTSTINALGNITVSVNPNPSDNVFNISITNLNNSNKIDLQIMDISGRPVYQVKQLVPDGSNSCFTIWDAAAINSGIYFYHILIAGKSFSGKLVKI